MSERLVIVSNRVPAYGDRKEQSGGLAVALDEALKQETLWFGWSGQTAPVTSTEPTLNRRRSVTLATIDLGEEDYRRFYVGFANGSLHRICIRRCDDHRLRIGKTTDDKYWRHIRALADAREVIGGAADADR